MTDVYLGLDSRAGRSVVLKIVEESSDSLTPVVIDAERRGAAIQKQLHDLDSRVVEVYEYGDHDGCFFIAMEYVEGRNVAELLRQEKRLEPFRAVRLALEICSQLGRLHSFVADIDGQKRAVIHGDIKPSNIQIGADDEVRLLDFGIAKVITFTHNLTHHDLGSPSYCSPERLSRAQVDHHADLWALGVTLYEMVAGSPPYQAQNTRKLESLIQSRRPPRALPDQCPPALKAIIGKALAGDLRQRYVSAGAFAQDLDYFLHNRPTRAEQEKRVLWPSNATVEKPHPETGLTQERAAASHGWRGRVVPFMLASGGLLLGLLAGLMVLVPVVYFAWSWKRSGDPPRSSYLAAADEVIERYRNSADPSLKDFDWPKAAIDLRRALDLNAADPAAKGKLALCLGYIDLLHNADAGSHFAEAASLLPRSPDPHLALARMYTYSLPNVGKAAAEFQQAQRFGFPPGPREVEQQADGYRMRAGEELHQAFQFKGRSRVLEGRWLELARRDFDRARQLYEPIAGFSNVSGELQQVEQADQSRKKLEDALRAPPHPKKVRNWRSRHWR